MANVLMLNYASLKESLRAVLPVIKNHTTRPVIQNVLLKFCQESVRLVSTDMVCYLQADVEKEIVRGAPGEALISARILSQILTENESDVVKVDVDRNHVGITIGNAEYTLPSPEASEFPVWPDCRPQYQFEINSAAMHAGIQLTSFAASKAEERPGLTGVMLDFEESGSVNFVATDTRRVSAYGIHLSDSFKGISAKPILTAVSCKAIQKMFPDSVEYNLNIGITPSSIVVEGKGRKLFSLLSEGRFPNWRSILPKKDKRYQTDIFAGKFLNGVRLGSMSAERESNAVDISIKNSEMVIRSMSEKLGFSNVRIIATHDEQYSKDVRLDAKKLGDFLKLIPPEGVVQFYCPASDDPVLLAFGDSQSYILAPMESNE